MKKLLPLLLFFISFQSTAQSFTLWGLTSNGGENGGGVLFEYSPRTHDITTKVAFDYSNMNGQNPQGGLMQATNGKIYGLAQAGGPDGNGVLFEYDPGTSTYTIKVAFDGSNGANPAGGLIEASNGKLYGMTAFGGSNFAGVLFEFDPATDAFTIKREFGGSGGEMPFGSLVQAGNGKLYGMTYAGGDYGAGVIFEYDPATNTYQKKFEFDYTNGGNPYGSLTEAGNGKLYGMTYAGGDYWGGVLFEYDPATNSYSKKIEFDYTNGANPFGSLTLADNGKLYGMTSTGGNDWSGVLFEYIPGVDVYTKKVDFNNINGTNPLGDLLQAANGKLYGMTSSGGSNYGAGVLFEYDLLSNSLEIKLQFNGSNGSNPYYGKLLAVTSEKIHIPDNNFEAYLEANGMGDGIAGNNLVLYASVKIAPSLNISGQQIADLSGIDYFEALQSLDCSNNSLTRLDVSKNKLLTSLICHNNLLTALDVSNGNNSNFTGFNATNNPSLYCIKVDDPAYSTTNWTQKDNQASYSHGCTSLLSFMSNVPIDPIYALVNGSSFSISPALPAGLSVNTATGVITGTPSVASSPTVYTLTIDGIKTTILQIEIKDLADISARYIQVRATYSSDAGQVNIYELLAFSNGKNVAYRKPVTANSYEGGGDACNNGIYAVDGYIGSRYSSDRYSPFTSTGSPVIVTVLLSEGEGYNLDNIFMDTGGWLEDFKIYVSEDSIHWLKYGEANQFGGTWPDDNYPSEIENIPTITTVTPGYGTAGTIVTITGPDLNAVYGVDFGGVKATSFTRISSTQVSVEIAPGTPQGTVQVTLLDKCDFAFYGPTTYFNVLGIIYVNDNATGANNGSDWANAFTDLQTAIDAASTGSTIYVAAGTYQPSSGGQSFSMKEGVKIYGGFAGTETLLSERDLASNISILQGNNSSVIRNDNNGLTQEAVLDGFTITGGVAGSGNGGGIMNNNASPFIINCRFSGNSADNGGGIYNTNNSAPVIVNAVFSGNAANNGGGIYNDQSEPTLTNTTFSGNRAIVDGGSIYNINNAHVSVTNSILWGNSSGIVNATASDATVTYSITENSTSGNGNLSIDPQFINAPLAATAPFTAGNYHLQSCSPAINAGTNGVYAVGQPVDLSAVTYDLAGVSRIQFDKADMGAYESAANTTTAAAAAQNVVTSNIQSSGSITYYPNNCNEIVAAVTGNSTDPVNGNTTVKVWIETVPPLTFVKRHYEITPGAGTTGRVTLYFTQADFDDFNSGNSTKLPQNPSDNAGIANIRVEKRSGSSSDNTGLPGSYPATTPVIIPNNQLQINWNALANRWEISFDVTGFSGFFINTTGITLPLHLLGFNATSKECNTTIEWTTADENNVAGFEIQQSANGNSFTTIKTVNAQNTRSTNHYSVTIPTPGDKTFYRLKMKDQDGVVKYSKVSFVSSDCHNKVTVFPNPAVNKITIYNASLGSNYGVYDNTGRKVAGGRIDQVSKEIDLKGITPGLLYVWIEGRSYKIIKTE